MLAQEYHKRYPLAMVAGDRVQDNGQGYKVRVRQNDLGTIRGMCFIVVYPYLITN